MPLLELKEVSKVYIKEDKTKFYALEKTSLSFNNCGLVSICGKSGSGKSTFINLIGLLDYPSTGNIFFKGKDINKFNSISRNYYRNNNIGIVFQHYQLLENETVLFNVMIPLLIKGITYKKAKRIALEELKKFSFPENLFSHKCKDLSGGEKQRVAILRTLITSPEIILCDEPTGALDTLNSIKVMDMIKEASKSKLVIMVSHNENLVQKYSDQIIKIKDGNVVSNEYIRTQKYENVSTCMSKKVKSDDYVDKLALSHFKKRFKRNLISIIALSFGLITSSLIFGFNYGSGNSIKNECYKQLDIGSLLVNKEISKPTENQGISITQTLRPSKKDLEILNKRDSDVVLDTNIDCLFSNSTFTIGEAKIEDITFNPIYSFNEKFINYSLLKEGNIPNKDSLNLVLINQTCYDKLKKLLNYSPINLEIKLSSNYEYHYYSLDEKEPIITDYFSYENYIKIVGVVQELEFLNSPKIYYSYLAYENFLIESKMNNLSLFLNEDISWYDWINQVSDVDQLSSYSMRLFLKNINNLEIINEMQKDIEGSDLVISSNALSITNALSSLIDACSKGLIIFLFIAIIGTILILGIISYSAYMDDKKECAILMCLGVSRIKIIEIYVIESLFVGFISSLFNFVFVPLLENLVNLIIFNFSGLENLINIPFLSAFNIKFIYQFSILLIVIISCFIATALPILLSHKISLKEELADE